MPSKSRLLFLSLLVSLLNARFCHAEDPGEMFSGLQDKEQTSGAFDLLNWINTPPTAKPVFVKAIMEQARKHDVKLSHSADWYLEQLNALASFSQSRSYNHFLKTPLARNLANIAVLNCDWNNGAEPREFAQKYLGQKQLDELGELYPEGLQALEAGCPAQSATAFSSAASSSAARE